jgi:nucleotide-binding universal stress UspA family protein
MKILLATDGSEHSRAALDAVAGRPWPARTQVRVLSVVHPIPFIVDPALTGMALYAESVIAEGKRAPHDVEAAVKLLKQRAPELKTSKAVLEGSPKHRIVEEAERWKADLIVMGSHGRSPIGRFLLGSVADAVVRHAPCSVEIVRLPDAALRKLARPKTTSVSRGRTR